MRDVGLHVCCFSRIFPVLRAVISQVMVESARRVSEAGVFEQGAGELDVLAAFHLLSDYKPRASLLPPALDLTDPYMWPYNRQASSYGIHRISSDSSVEGKQEW